MTEFVDREARRHEAMRESMGRTLGGKIIRDAKTAGRPRFLEAIDTLQGDSGVGEIEVAELIQDAIDEAIEAYKLEIEIMERD